MILVRGRAAGAAIYPRALCEAIRRGVPAALGTVRAGEALYLPSNVIHLLDNVQDVVAVAWHFRVNEPYGKHVEERFIMYTDDKTMHWWFPKQSYQASWTLRMAESILSGTFFRDHFWSTPQRVALED